VDLSEFPEHQIRIIESCYHPSGVFEEFTRGDVEQSIPDRFAKIVARYPDRIAVRFDGASITYRKLDQWSHQIASLILDCRGVGEEPIGLMMEKSLGLIAAILGVLKSGKTLVPLEPATVRHRLEHMVADSGSSLIVTNQKNLSSCERLCQGGRQCLNIDRYPLRAAQARSTRLSTAETLAWIVYTSGSTGAPKGVVQTHRSKLHSIRGKTNLYHLCPLDRIGQPLSWGFGSSLEAVLCALLNGATLVPFDTLSSGLGAMRRWLDDERISVIGFVPTMYRGIVETLSGEDLFPHLRVLRFTGEPARITDVTSFQQLFSSECVLLNCYGTSETPFVRAYCINRTSTIEGDGVPLGYEVEGSEILILDEQGQPVGGDGVGEIAIKSKYLAHSYWNGPDLTKERFLPDPEGGDERIYLTGDLGFMESDGCLHHMGRKDFQIQIRGHRVESAEVEMAPLSVEGISEAAVVATESGSGDNRLIAYYVEKRGSGTTTSTLRRSLEERLPEYMVPSVFIKLDVLPKTPSGKLDRTALPDPGNERPDLDTEYEAPRTPVEESLAAIWMEVLGIDGMGINDDFRDLGGNSVMAGQIISRVIDKFNVELPVRALLQCPTVAKMTTVITQSMTERIDERDLAQILKDMESEPLE
jgi:amino acid adenylation domain-containing protein